MHRKQLLTDLKAYRTSPFIKKDEHAMLDRTIEFVETNPGCFDRSNKGHVTGSAWIVSNDLSKTLLTHHRKLDIWVQVGGHADSNSDIQAVARQEALEESGIKDLELVTPDIYDIDIHAIPGNCTYHYDVRYILKAPHGASYIVSDESHDLAWVPIEKVKDFSTDRSVLRMAEKMPLIKTS